MATPAPDWYEDPTRRHLRRWYDGGAWTDRVQRHDGSEALDPLGGPPSGVTAPTKRPVGLLAGGAAGLVLLLVLVVGIVGAGEEDAPALDRAEAVAAGNVARCQDGTYSDNVDLAATCSSRGGVEEWLATYGECGDGTVIEMVGRPSCLGHDDFRGLKPRGWTPPTTTTAPAPATSATTAPPPTAAPPPTTAPPTTLPPTTRPPAPTAPPTTAAPPPPVSDCHPSYSPCVPNVPGDLNCPDVGFPVTIHGSDPYGLDGNDNDGLGCESY